MLERRPTKFSQLNSIDKPCTLHPQECQGSRHSPVALQQLKGESVGGTLDEIDQERQQQHERRFDYRTVKQTGRDYWTDHCALEL